jgi:hypothetical protein
MNQVPDPDIDAVLRAVDARPTTAEVLEQLAGLVGSSFLPAPRVRWNAAGLAASEEEWDLAGRELIAALERGQSAFARRDPSFARMRARWRGEPFRRILKVGASVDLLAALDLVGPDVSARLRRHDIVTPRDLLNAAGAAGPRAALAAATGVSAARLMAMAHHAELALIVAGVLAGPPAAGKADEAAPASPTVVVNVGVANATSQTASNASLRARLKALEARVSALEKTGDLPAVPTPAAVRRLTDRRALRYVNLMAVAGVETKTDLATWASAADQLVDDLARLNDEVAILSGRVAGAVVKGAIAAAAAQGHVERVAAEPAADKKPPTPAAPPRAAGAAASETHEGMAEQTQPAP